MFDKFHILRHLNDALDAVRRSEYARAGQAAPLHHSSRAGFPRTPRKASAAGISAGCGIKGNRHTLLAHRENPDLDGRNTLKTLLAAHKRRNTA